MPVYQQLVHFDQMFSQLREPPIIINDLVNASDEEKARIRDFITTRYSSDMLSILPSCQCGETKGEYVVGCICESCKTQVRSVVDEDIEPLVWFRVPEGVFKLISPIVWIMLKNRFKKSGFNIIQWLCDTTYRPNVRTPKLVNEMVEMGFQRGYNYFCQNFDSIMAKLFEMRAFKLKKGQHDYLQELLLDYRDRIFSNFLPLPNKSLLIIEKSNVGIYIDMSIVGAIDAIEMITSIDSPMSEHSVRTKENRAVKAIVKLSEFYESFFKSNLSGKPGILRKHVFGSRTHFAFRAVVTSLTNAHEYDEIHIPWGIGVTAFRPHLMNKLLKRGFDHNAAIGFLYGHVEKYHPLLDEIFNELITESEFNGIPCIIQRNPSLLQGSAQLVRVKKVKPDPSDHTVSLSILIVTSMNCDFDGDALNLSIAIDNKMARHWQALAPHKNVFVLSKPREVSGNISIPKPVIATMSNWMRSAASAAVDENKLREMAMFEVQEL